MTTYGTMRTSLVRFTQRRIIVEEKIVIVVIVDVLVIVFGLVMGSFFNVVAERMLHQESIVFPPSHCPHCQVRLGVAELIPIMSYVVLRGRCRHCRVPISPLYPLGEAVTAFFFYLVYLSVGLTTELFVGWVLCVLLVLAVLTDLREKLILDIVTIPCLLLLILLRLFIGEQSFYFYLMGGLVGFLLLAGIAWVSRGGMGGGDIKLFAAIGVALGPWLTLMSFVLASFLGAIIGVLLMIFGLVERKQPIPFAPFIAVGTLIAYLYGDELWRWYIHIG